MEGARTGSAAREHRIVTSRGRQGRYQSHPDGPHGLQQPLLIEGLVKIIEQTVEVMGFDRVEHLADVIVGGDALDLEKGTGVIAAAGPLPVPLEAQERGALGEEDRESRQGEVGHVEEEIVAGAPIGQLCGDRAQPFDEVTEAARIHAPSNAGTGSKVQVTIG